MLGKTISHYKIIEPIGDGGMGVVYKAQDFKLDRFVALKFLPANLSTSDKEKQRFIHEAKTASALQHNNICTIHEIDETENGQLFICMDYYEGETLKKKIERNTLELNEILNIFSQLAEGLKKAHTKGIIHRDLNPANIMVLNDDSVKILDFGIAEFLSGSKITKEGITIGTVGYMSPEQAKGDKLDIRSDIWSLGVVLYAMLTGKTPFKGDYDQVILYSIMNEDPQPLTNECKDVPDELIKIVYKCLQKDPSNRYRHVEDLVLKLSTLNPDLKFVSSQPKKIFFKRIFTKHDKSVWLPISFIVIILILSSGYFITNRITQNESLDAQGKVESKWANSVAVLPLVDLSPGGDQEFFCDGMTDHIINNLAKYKNLKVIALPSVINFKDIETGIADIGKILNVQNILRGSVSRDGNRVRVVTQLASAVDGSIIWTEKYDRAYTDIFAIYDGIAQTISDLLLKELGVIKVAVDYTQKPKIFEAYEYYLKGRYWHAKFLSSRNLEEFEISQNMFQKALELDPEYALANAGLAELYLLFYDWHCDTEEDLLQYLNLQNRYIDKALSINPYSPDANRIQGLIYGNQGEIVKAFSMLKKAIELNPNSAECNYAFSQFLFKRGLLEQALTYSNRAIELNPLNPVLYNANAVLYMFNGKYDRAEINFQKSLEIDPAHVPVLNDYKAFLIHVKKYDKAKEVIKRLIALSSNESQDVHLKVLLLALNGEKQQALSNIKKLDNLWIIVNIYHILGMYKEAIEPYLEKITQMQETESPLFQLLNITNNTELIKDVRFQRKIAEHKKLYEENLKKYSNMN